MATVTRSIKNARLHIGGGRRVARLVRDEKRLAHRVSRRVARYRLRIGNYDDVLFDEPRFTELDLI